MINEGISCWHGKLGGHFCIDCAREFDATKRLADEGKKTWNTLAKTLRAFVQDQTDPKWEEVEAAMRARDDFYRDELVEEIRAAVWKESPVHLNQENRRQEQGPRGDDCLYRGGVLDILKHAGREE